MTIANNNLFILKKRLFYYGKQQYLILSCCFFYTVFLIYTYAHFNNFFDFTDESYYLLSVKYADSMFGVSQFGHYTGLIYTLAFKNIFIHRIVGALLLLAASFYLTYYLEKILDQTLQSDRFVNISTAWLMTSFSLFYYGNSFLLGLSHNWLSLLGTIMFLGGIFSVLDNENQKKHSYYKPLYLSLGGWLAWNAKPPTAVGLVFLLGVFFLIHLKANDLQKVRLLKDCSLSILIFLCLHILFFENGVASYIKEYTDGLMAINILSGHKVSITQKLLQFWEQYKSIFVTIFSKKTTFFYLAIAICLKIIFWLMYYFKFSTWQWQKRLAWGCTVLLLLTFLPLDPSLGFKKLALIALYFYTIVFFISVINFDMEIVVYQKREKLLAFFYQKIYLASLSVLFILAPFAITIGTNNAYSQHMFKSSGLIFLAIYILIRSNCFFRKSANLFVILWVIIAAITIFNGMKSPYRMPESVFTETHKTRFFTDNSELNLNSKANKYIVQLQQSALENNWVIGNPLIDLTGGTPGAALALGAHVFGTPWLLGGYKGSNNFAIFALNHYSAENLRNAWVLSSANARRRLDNAILRKLGLDFPANYKKVGTISFDYHRKEVHDLWKPNI